MPARQLRCETYVVPEDDRTGENAIECGALALACTDCGDSRWMRRTRPLMARRMAYSFASSAQMSTPVWRVRVESQRKDCVDSIFRSKKCPKSNRAARTANFLATFALPARNALPLTVLLLKED